MDFLEDILGDLFEGKKRKKGHVNVGDHYQEQRQNPSQPRVVESNGGQVCKACNGGNGSTAKFCMHCGSKLMAEKLFCTNCGEEQARGSRFCSGCGQGLARS